MSRRLKTLEVAAAEKLMRAGAVMIDVRESGEYARARIPGSQNIALSQLELSELPLGPDQAVVFLCASGNRTNIHDARLADKAGDADAYAMQGGLSAWARAGLPIESGAGRPEGENNSGRGLLSGMFRR